MLLLSHEVTDFEVGDVRARMTNLAFQSSDIITLVLDSPGGDVEARVSLRSH
jgi:ATP-dependent protease ClpP protease subunit